MLSHPPRAGMRDGSLPGAASRGDQNFFGRGPQGTEMHSQRCSQERGACAFRVLPSCDHGGSPGNPASMAPCTKAFPWHRKGPGKDTQLVLNLTKLPPKPGPRAAAADNEPVHRDSPSGCSPSAGGVCQSVAPWSLSEPEARPAGKAAVTVRGRRTERCVPPPLPDPFTQKLQPTCSAATKREGPEEAGAHTCLLTPAFTNGS